MATDLKLNIPNNINPRLYMVEKANKRRMLFSRLADKAPVNKDIKAIVCNKGIILDCKGNNTSDIKVTRQERYTKGGIIVKKPQTGKMLAPITSTNHKWNGAIAIINIKEERTNIAPK